MPDPKTVKIVVDSHPDRVVTINEEDFNPETMSLYEEVVPSPEPQPAPESVSEDPAEPQPTPRKRKSAQ